jgi:hypothetical protein
MEDNALTIERGKPRRDGKIRCAAKLGGKTLHVAWIDETNSEDRTAFAAAVAKDRPGIQAAEIEDGLLQDAGCDDGEEKERSQASRLIDIATLRCELWHTPENEAYATLDVGHREHWRVRSKAFRQWLAGEYFRRFKTAVNTEAVQATINTLEGMSLFAQPADHKPTYPGQPAPGREHPVYVRLAEQSGVIYMDLCDTAWRAAIITPSGWRVADDHLVRFRRARGMLPLPVPVKGGTVQALRPFVNVIDDEWPLLLGWLLAAMRPRGPYPILCLHGEQGSAKSSTARALRALVDPSGAPLRSEPKEPRDLMIAASNGAVLAFDNLSHVPAWLSDALCRLSTGGGFATRELYTDNEEVIFDAMRPVILTGIEELATRSDLLDRAVLLTLPTIPEERRRPEAEFWAAFGTVAPAILGSLLTAVSEAMRRLPAVKLPRLPRMADFALWATAGERALGLADGAFITAYSGNRQGANELAIESSPVAGPLLAMMESTAEWIGTASELLAALDAKADDRTRRLHGWPKGARALAGIIKRLAPNLRRLGIEVDTAGHVGRGSAKRKAISLVRKEGESIAPTRPTYPSPGNMEPHGADGSANGAGGVATGAQPVPLPRPEKTGGGVDGDAKIPADSDSAHTPDDEVVEWTA